MNPSYNLVHKQLLNWYKTFGRHDLPWRNTNDVYHVYISEIMLQQTQVSRVKEYFYPNFLEIYPSLEVLAKADIDEVLINWSGLGYYTRARNIHKTAKLIYKYGLPDEQKELEKLPGIGRYTASAICSFGYKQSVSVVDTNIARVLKRYFALFNMKDKIVWEYANDFLNPVDPTHHNLALMDLGSVVCTPKDPSCSECPLQNSCQGKSDPIKYTQTKKISYEKLELFYGVYIQNGKLAVQKSTNKLYHGMYELPQVDPIEENKIGSFKHSYTKYRITVNLYTVDELYDELEWVELEKLDQIPLSSLMQKALKLVLN
jgi:A/G-specific adenine glycosylase